MSRTSQSCKLTLLAIASLLLTCCNKSSGPSGNYSLRATVPLGKQSGIVIKTKPMAACIVRPADAATTATGARFFSDQQGYARFFVTPNASAESTTRLALHCESSSGNDDQVVELRGSNNANSDYPPPPQMPAPVGQARRALSRDQAANMSDADLIKGGYPLPPDERLSPAEYAIWLRDVSAQRIMVNPGIFLNRFVRHDYGNTRNGASTSNNWSGVELTGTSGPFAWVSAWWTVPSVTGETNTQTNSSTWVGIDGDSTTDLAQSGTEQDAFGTGSALVTTYRAWTELLPNQPTESVLTGISISPGDQIFTEVWVGPAGGSPSLTNPSFMVVCMEDLTTSGGACFNYTPLGSTIIGGSEAEWIMERPGENCDSSGHCTLAELANFGNVSVFTTNVMARRPDSGKNQGYVGCCGTGSFLINMTSDGSSTGTTLDTTNTTGGTINFQWAAFH